MIFDGTIVIVSGDHQLYPCKMPNLIQHLLQCWSRTDAIMTAGSLLCLLISFLSLLQKYIPSGFLYIPPSCCFSYQTKSSVKADTGQSHATSMASTPHTLTTERQLIPVDITNFFWFIFSLLTDTAEIIFTCFCMTQKALFSELSHWVQFLECQVYPTSPYWALSSS